MCVRSWPAEQGLESDKERLALAEKLQILARQGGSPEAECSVVEASCLPTDYGGGLREVTEEALAREGTQLTTTSPCETPRGGEDADFLRFDSDEDSAKQVLHFRHQPIHLDVDALFNAAEKVALSSTPQFAKPTSPNPEAKAVLRKSNRSHRRRLRGRPVEKKTSRDSSVASLSGSAEASASSGSETFKENPCDASADPRSSSSHPRRFPTLRDSYRAAFSLLLSRQEEERHRRRERRRNREKKKAVGESEESEGQANARLAAPPPFPSLREEEALAVGISEYLGRLALNVPMDRVRR